MVAWFFDREVSMKISKKDIDGYIEIRVLVSKTEYKTIMGENVSNLHTKNFLLPLINISEKTNQEEKIEVMEVTESPIVSVDWFLNNYYLHHEDDEYRYSIKRILDKYSELYFSELNKENQDKMLDLSRISKIRLSQVYLAGPKRIKTIEEMLGSQGYSLNT